MAARSDKATRARDIDRALVATALDNAYADGQLTFDEHRERVESARAARTLGQLHTLAADLQADVPLPEATPRPVRSPRRRAVGLGAAVVLVVLALAVYLGTRGSSPAPADAPSRPIATADGTVVPIVATPFDFATADGLADFRARYLARFTDPTVTEVVVYPTDNRASVTRVVGERTHSVNVDGGFDEYGQSEPIDTNYLPFDIGAIDFSPTAGLMAGAPAMIGVPDAAITHVIARNYQGSPEVLIYAADADNRGGYVQTNFGGDVERVVGYEP